MPPKIRIIGDKWPPASNTYANLDIAKSLKDNISDLATATGVDASELESAYNVHRTMDKTKPSAGPVIPLEGENLDQCNVDKVPIIWVKKKGGAAPAAKPGAKPPAGKGLVKKVPPPPGAKTSSPSAAGATAKTASPPTAGKVAPGGKKMPASVAAALAAKKAGVPPPPKGAKVVAKPAAKPTDDDSSAPPSPRANDSEKATDDGASPTNKDDDSDAGSGSPTGGGGGGGSVGFNSAMMGGMSGSGGGGGGDSDSDNNTSSPTNKGGDDSDKDTSTSTPPPAPAAKPTAKKIVPKPGAKPGLSGSKSSTPPPEAHSSSGGETSVSSNSHILAVQGSSGGMDNVAGALAAQRAVDEKLLTLQKTLVEEEKKRVENYENNLRHALAAEVDQIKQSLNASMQEERARAMQVQQILEEQRTQLLRALAERDGQLQLAQSALQEAVQLGGTKAGPALAAINDKSGGAASGLGGSNNTELASQMKEQNDQLRKLIVQKDKDALGNKAATRAELDTMVQRQTELVGAIGTVSASQSSQNSAAVGLQRKTLSDFLNHLGLGRFLPVLEKQDIDYDILSGMTDEELHKAGVDTVGARKRILLEFIKTRQQQVAQQNAATASRSSFDDHGSGAGAAAAAAAAGSPSKRVVISEQNNTVHLPPPFGKSSGSSSSSSASRAAAGPKTPDQLQADVQAQTEAAAALPPKLQDHHRILLLLFRRAGASDWLSRTAEMVTSFKDSLPALYEAVGGKLGVPAPNYAPGTGATALKQFINRQFPHLSAAIDVMAFLADGREAEFADTMILRQIKVAPQRLVWYSVPVPTSKAPETAEDGGSGEKLYFYSALSKMSQWKRPTILEDKSVPKVVLPSKSLDDALPQPGDKLPSNPNAGAVSMHRATDQQYVAATVAMLMRNDPARLAQFPQFLKAYERPIAGAEGKEGKINYRGMFSDCLAAYAPQDM